MNETSNVVRGILKVDGTLKLDQRPSVPAGPVKVTIRPLATEDREEDIWEYMQRSRAELEAAGHRFRTKEEIDSALEDDRDWDGKIDEVYRQFEEERQRSTGP
ncbi:hypothetical protein P12x_000110 [Tundrisphaera lichenicola]|uniref:hypothetical protein n=1 Tax=Tundrisphaera lichenicola TaxID=2029860 RepID=UPI003EB78669